MKSGVVAAFSLLVSVSATEFSLADLSAALGSDDECSQNGHSLECALELAQLKVARRHRDSPEAETPASPDTSAEAQAAEAPAAEAPAPEAPAEVPPADFGHPEWLSDCKR